MSSQSHPHDHARHHGHSHHHTHRPDTREMIGAPSLLRLSAMQRLGGALLLSAALGGLLLWCLQSAGI